MQTGTDAPARLILQLVVNELPSEEIVDVMVTVLDPLKVSTECVVPVTPKARRSISRARIVLEGATGED